MTLSVLACVTWLVVEVRTPAVCTAYALKYAVYTPGTLVAAVVDPSSGSGNPKPYAP